MNNAENILRDYGLLLGRFERCELTAVEVLHKMNEIYDGRCRNCIYSGHCDSNCSCIDGVKAWLESEA